MQGRMIQIHEDTQSYQSWHSVGNPSGEGGRGGGYEAVLHTGLLTVVVGLRLEQH